MATLSYINVFAGMPPSRWLDELKLDVSDFDGNTITLDNGDGTETILYSDASGFTQGAGGSFSGNVISMELIDPNQSDLLLQQVTGVGFKVEDLIVNFPDAAFFILGDGSTVNVNSGGIEDGAEIWNYRGADIWNIGQDAVTVHADNIDGETFTFSATSVGPLGETISYKYNSDGTLNTDAVRLNLSLNGIQDLDFLREGSGSALGITDPFADDTFFGVNHAIGSEGNDFIRGAAWIGNTVWIDPNASSGSNINLSRVGSTLEGGGGHDTLDRAYIGYGGMGDDYITIYAGGEINHEWSPGSQDYPDFGASGNVFGDTGAIGGGPPVGYFAGGGHAHGGSGHDTFQLLPGTISTAVATTIHYYIDGDSGSDWINAAVRFSGVNSFGERTILPFDATDFSAFGVFTLDVNLSTNFANFVLGINPTSSSATQIVYEVHNIENVRGSNKSDRIIGDDQNNIIEGDDGADELSGAGGIDTVSYEHSDAAVNVDLSTNTVSGGHADGDLIFFFENIMGSAHNDNLTGDNGANNILGEAGNDTIHGGFGADTINGGEGIDTLNGDQGNDTINGGAGADIIDGGAGQGEDTINGGAGNDTINGRNGVDILSGGADNDIISGQNKNDVLMGDGGEDTLNGNQGNDTLLGGDDNDILNGGAAADTLNGQDGDDDLFGGGQADILNGGSGMDELDGGSGNDTLSGGGDGDILFGGNNDDTLNGNSGADELRGGAGNDRLTGGSDAGDIFVFDASDAGSDTITDYQDNLDSFRFTGGISAGDITVTDSGSMGQNARIEVAGTGIVITVQNVDHKNIDMNDFMFI